MYEHSPDTSRLRQGDVLGEFYFPRFSFGAVHLLHAFADDGSLTFDDRAQLSVQRGPAVVISQCCEFNEGKRNAFSLARLVSVRRRLAELERTRGLNIARLVPLAKSSYRGREVTPTLVRDLEAANEIDPDADQNAAVNVYLYRADGTVLTEPHIADFSEVISIRIADSERLKKQKRLELEPAFRRQFQLKLAYFYGREAK